jgi:hypothetical protein
MTVNRRRLLQSLALAGGCTTAAPGAETAITLDVLRNVSAVHGTNLSDDRLRVIKPVLEQNFPQLQAFRNFELDETVEPTQGLLDR